MTYKTKAPKTELCTHCNRLFSKSGISIHKGWLLQLLLRNTHKQGAIKRDDRAKHG